MERQRRSREGVIRLAANKENMMKPLGERPCTITLSRSSYLHGGCLWRRGMDFPDDGDRHGRRA